MYVNAAVPFSNKTKGGPIMADIHLIKKILAEIERMPCPMPLDIPGYSREQINRHLEMLDDDEPGELAGMFSNDFVWNELTSKFSRAELDSMPLSVIEKMATRLTEKWASAKLGLG
jgi:hypothetical protein